MSDGRVVAETITETVVDTALTYGAGIVVGAAITAVAGSVAVPGVVVVAASGAIIAGVNAGVQALTGKSTTEWISDGILDTGKAIGNKIRQRRKICCRLVLEKSFAYHMRERYYMKIKDLLPIGSVVRLHDGEKRR